MMDLSPPPINNILCLLFIIVLVYNLLIVVLIYKNDDGIYADIIISKSGKYHTINANDWNPIIHFSSAIQMSLIEVCTWYIHACHQVSQHISDHNCSDKSSVVFSRPVHHHFEKLLAQIEEIHCLTVVL